MSAQRSKRIKAELIPSPARMLQTENDQAKLERLVQQKVAETLAARELFVFEPFFRTRQVAYEIRRLQTVPELKKWSVYYDRYGCLFCKEQTLPHASHGFCRRCLSRVSSQLNEIIRDLVRDTGERNPEARLYLPEAHRTDD